MATYVLNFQGLADYAQHFLSGLALTAELAVAATVGGIALGIIGGIVRNGKKATVGYQPEIWKTWE